MRKDINYEDLPTDVKEVVENGTSALQLECASCEDTLYFTEAHKNEHPSSGVFVDNKGCKRGEYGRGGVYVYDEMFLPRQVEDSNGSYLCAFCTETEYMEEHGSELFGIDPDGTIYGVFILGTIIYNHYASDAEPIRSDFGLEDTFEAYVLDDQITINGEDVKRFEQGEDINGHSLTKDNILDRENPFDVPIIADNQYIFVPTSVLD